MRAPAPVEDGEFASAVAKQLKVWAASKTFAKSPDVDSFMLEVMREGAGCKRRRLKSKIEVRNVDGLVTYRNQKLRESCRGGSRGIGGVLNSTHTRRMRNEE